MHVLGVHYIRSSTCKQDKSVATVNDSSFRASDALTSDVCSIPSATSILPKVGRYFTYVSYLRSCGAQANNKTQGMKADISKLPFPVERDKRPKFCPTSEIASELGSYPTPFGEAPQGTEAQGH